MEVCIHERGRSDGSGRAWPEPGMPSPSREHLAKHLMCITIRPGDHAVGIEISVFHRLPSEPASLSQILVVRVAYKPFFD